MLCIDLLAKIDDYLMLRNSGSCFYVEALMFMFWPVKVFLSLIGFTTALSLPNDAIE